MSCEPNTTGNLLQPGTPLVPSQSDIDKLKQLANAYYESEKNGCTYGEKCKSPQGYFVKMMIGLSLGIDPPTAVGEICSSRSGHSMSAALKMTIARRRGMATIEIIETDAEHAVVEVRRADWAKDRKETVSFSITDAKQAKLTGKDNWKNYPQEMCVHGAERRACNIYLPDVTLGCGYTHDEVGQETSADGRLVEFAEVAQAAGFGATAIATPPPAHVEEPEPTNDDFTPDAGEVEKASEPPAAETDNRIISEAMTEEIGQMVQTLGYTPAECKQRFSSLYGAAKLADLTPFQTREFHEKLKSLQGLHALRKVVKMPSDDEWREVVLPRKGVSHDLDLTPEQIEEIHGKLFAKTTPFDKPAGGDNGSNSTAKNELAPALAPPA